VKEVIFGLMFLMFVSAALAEPYGASLIPGESSRKADPEVNNVTAEGGNTTFLNVDLSQTTRTWQGFFGTVTGGILLEDAGGNRFYDWDLVDAVGEIIATRSIITDWSSINCTNQTQLYEEEQRLSILDEHSDGINNTFYMTSHPVFDIAGRILEGCRATRTYNQTDSQSVFWNVLLNTDPATTVYAVIMENDKVGFDGSLVDFQILVPVDRQTGQSTYYMYVELG
jgi:hypothetical protein